MAICKKGNKKLYVCTLFIILLVCFGCSSADNNSSEIQTEQINLSDVNISPEPSIEKPEQTENVVNAPSVIDKFIDLYNSSTVTQITDVSDMDIQGDDYRTEFRLNAFKNAVGKKCSVGSSYVEIVSYSTLTHDSIRFYTHSDSLDSVTELFTSIVYILDETIPNDEIKEICDSLIDSDQNIVLGSGNYITGYISHNYKISGYDMMIDCSKINYLD